MYKKFFNAIVLVFAFLFLNLSFNSVSINAEEMPNDIYDNAGWGEKAGYWAIINYGADYIGTKEIIIDIQKEAIANEEVRFIVVTENEYTSETLTYFERNVSPDFSSKINYTLKNSSFGKKYITILLLKELVNNPSEGLIVDKIIVEVDQKRNISGLSPSDILVTPEVPPEIESTNPYKVNVTLNPDTILGEVDDYVIKSIKYRLVSKNIEYLNGLQDVGINNYYFMVYRNSGLDSYYEIIVEDIFGYTITTKISINNLKDPAIMIEVEPETTLPINRDYIVAVRVVYYETNYVLNSNELELLDVTFNGYTYSIKENMQIIVRENGIYTITAETLNGSMTQFILQIDNIDKENPYVQVLSTINVYTENVDAFMPGNEIFVYDNVTPGEKINITMTYYTVIFVEETPVINQLFTGSFDDVKYYLWQVRDLILRYTVTDEAGNSVERDSYIHSIDNTKPTIQKTTDRMLLYINDDYPSDELLERAYGIIVSDNSLYEGTTKVVTYYRDFSQLPVDEFNKLNKLGEYRIFLSAVDEAGNMSESVVLVAEVRKRLITIEAGRIEFDEETQEYVLIEESLYSVYGDKIDDFGKYIGYHCVTRDGKYVPCSQELLEGDSIGGELYVLNAHYTGTYEIFYKNITIPSDLYYLEYGDINVFEIKPRTLKIVAHNKQKDYLDEDPELTFEIMDVCSDRPEDDIYKAYRCSLLDGDSFVGALERYKGDPPYGVDIWYDQASLSTSEAVWFNSEGNVVPRVISIGTLSVLELFNGGVNNYVLDFQNAEFTIWPKEVHAYVAKQEKIYGEADPVYTLRECRGKEPINSMDASQCMDEVKIVLSRQVSGEKVVSDVDGNYLDYYVISGIRNNMNYNVIFYDSYLTILRRDISISVVGDLDNNRRPTGKYTIYYEQDIPFMEVYDSSSGIDKGLAYNMNLTEQVADKFKYGSADLYTNCNGTCEETLLTEYVSGIGLYIIKKGSIEIVDVNDENAENNYNITFNEGILEVIKKKIWIKIIKDFTKVYGDNDAYFTEDDLVGYNNYIILEANGRFIIEITPTTLPGEDPYIPRDNDKMKYHLKRKEGIYVGFYDIFIELLEGCENYEVNMYEKYRYEITKRDINIDIYDQTIVYKDIPAPFTYNIALASSSLQYDDKLTGTPEVEPYRHVGKYKIGIGTIGVLDLDGVDVSFNYNFIVDEGTLTVTQREVLIRVSENQSKQYGENDPIIEFEVYYNGVLETISEDDYTGKLDREPGEVPGLYYTVNMGSLQIALNGTDDFNNLIGNYLIYEFDNTNKFYIEKRTVSLKARDVEAFYGNEYSQDIVYDAIGAKLAWNLTLKIDDQPIYDIFEGELKILGEVNGVGEYIISCEDIRIYRRYTGEDITDEYYNFSYENGILKIKARTIKIKPHSGQHKLYGESDTGITFDYYSVDEKPALLDKDDEFVGSLLRDAKNVNGIMVTEDAGTYNISLGTLSVKTASGKPNYDLVLDGTVVFTIAKRTLNVKANDLTIYYGDKIELTYTIDGDGLAYNVDIIPNIIDTITGELNLVEQETNREVDSHNPDHGIYRIMGDNLVVSNIHNYNYTFSPGLLVINKTLITVTPSAETLSKIYGENDPSYFKFTTDVNAAYTGELIREEGQDVGKYKILIGNLKFGPNYDVYLEESYFTINARVITVVPDKGQQKIFGQEDPILTYTYGGTLVGDDTFFGSLSRMGGNEVGEYEILQGSLALSNNYKIRFTNGIMFRIKYAEFTEINIYIVDNNVNQIKGEEELVQAYARFNAGANETNIDQIEWSVKKVLGNGDESNWEFTPPDDNNIITFMPSGSVGKYIITAKYDGKVATKEVLVEQSTVGNVYIRWLSGSTDQILGLEEQVTYYVILPENVNSDTTVHWIVNGVTVKSNNVSNIYFDYTPNLGKGEYQIQAKIGNRISDALSIIVKNNNPPTITLIGDQVVYVEALTGEYIEKGATVYDDIYGDITESLSISGYVDRNVIGTYYIRYDASDPHGNNAITVYRQVVVRDTTLPVVKLNSDENGDHREITLLYGQPYHEYGATAFDNYDGPVEVIINNTVVIDKVGTYDVIYIAYDKSGNPGKATRKVTIIDNVSPTITLLGDSVLDIEVYSEFDDPGAYIEDNVDGSSVISLNSTKLPDGAKITIYYGDEIVPKLDTSKLGKYQIRYDYKDSSGNIGAGKLREINVVDSTPPEIVLNGTNPYIVRQSYPDINYKEPGAIAYDNYDDYVEVEITGQLGSEIGTYYLYYNAVDSHGNIAKTVTRQVIVVDVENPIIRFLEECPQYITIEAITEKYDTNCDIPGIGISVEDDYKEDLEELQKRVRVTGTVDNTRIGTYIISYDVEDKFGNSAVTLNRYVRVVDTTAPKITLVGGDPKDHSQIVEVFEKYEELGAIVEDAYDDYHGIEIEIVISHDINVNKLGEYIVTYNAKDSNGNKAKPVIRKVYVKDTKAPVVTLVGDEYIYVERGLKYIEYGATAIDNYDGPIDIITIVGAPTGRIRGEFPVEYIAIDSSGNVGKAIRYVTVDDTIPPIVLGVEDGKYYKEPVSIYFIPTIDTDEKLWGWLNKKEITSPWYVDAEGTYDLVVKDDAGNITEIRFYIDTTPPQILGVKNGEYTNKEEVEVYSNELIKYYEYRYQNGDWLRTSEQRVKFNKEGIYRIYAVDMADNVSTMVTFTIDRTAPKYILTGVINKGITNTDVHLSVEEGASVVVNSSHNIPTLYTFTDDGYYHVVIRDLAANTVVLQFVVNKTTKVTVNNKIITIISQHNAIDKISITGNHYPRNSGYMLVKPLVEGGFEYVSGKLFSETEYQKLMAGETIEFGVSPTDDTYMYAGFVVGLDELNKFGTQTVDGDEDDDGPLVYIGLVLFLFAIIGFFAILFLRRRKRQEDEEDETEEVIIDDY